MNVHWKIVDEAGDEIVPGLFLGYAPIELRIQSVMLNPESRVLMIELLYPHSEET